MLLLFMTRSICCFNPMTVSVVDLGKVIISNGSLWTSAMFVYMMVKTSGN